MLTYGKGLKQDPLEKIIKHNNSYCNILGTVNGNLGQITINTNIYYNEEKKCVKKHNIDNKVIKHLEELNNHLTSVWFTPYMDNFFTLDSNHKRKFIDKLIFILYSNHSELLNKHNKLLKERLTHLYAYNNLTWLDKIEEQLVSVSVSIIAQRRLFIKQINNILINKLKYPIQLSFEGEIEELFNNNEAALKVEQELIKKLHSSRSTDKKNNQNSYSANKSKLVGFSLNHNTPCNQCSMGEQKTMVINIINAFIQLIIGNNKPPPIILLDEIDVHLDSENIDYIIQDMLKYNTQLFITTTNSSIYKNFSTIFNFLNLDTYNH